MVAEISTEQFEINLTKCAKAKKASFTGKILYLLNCSTNMSATIHRISLFVFYSDKKKLFVPFLMS